MTSTCLNANLIGEPGSRAKLQTPALMIDVDVFERNLARMADHAKAHGVALRPHAKTHKSVEDRQAPDRSRSARRVRAAKLGEAEALRGRGNSVDPGDISCRDRSPVLRA